MKLKQIDFLKKIGQRPELAFSLSLATISLFVPLLVGSEYIIHVLIMSFVYIIGAAGFRLMHTVGRLSLGQSVFMAVGGYTSALLALNMGINPFLGMLAGGITALILALLVGFPILKVGGVYFAIITLAVVELMSRFISSFEFTGGHVGLMDIPSCSLWIPFIGRYSFGTNKVLYYYLILFITVIFTVIIYSIERSRIGRVFSAIRYNDNLAQLLGINSLPYRLFAFGLGAFFSGVAGGFSAHYLMYLSPTQFDVMGAVMIQVYAVTGGLAYFVGPVVGTLIISALLESLRVAKEWQPIFYGAGLIIIVLTLSGGLASLPQVLINFFGRKRKRMF